MFEKQGLKVIAGNRSGAFGTIDNEIAAKAKPDGHNLAMGTTRTRVIAPASYARSAATRSSDLDARYVFALTPRTVLPSAAFLFIVTVDMGQVAAGQQDAGACPEHGCDAEQCTHRTGGQRHGDVGDVVDGQAQSGDLSRATGGGSVVSQIECQGLADAEGQSDAEGESEQ